MGQPVASLEVDFAMPIAGALADAKEFGTQVEKMAAAAVGQMDKVERAAKGMFDTSAAVSSAKKFGDATSATSAQAIRELNRIERAGESLSARLDRQLSTFGKTTAEIRAMKVETAALAAEQAGLAELAQRLRAQEADLCAAEYAQTRQQAMVEQALAEERAAASERAVADKAREAAATRNAAAAYQAFEERARAGAAALSSADAVINGLEKEAELFGKTAVQIRAMRVEEAALAAEQAGLPDQAARIRAAYQQLLNVEQAHSGSLGLNRTQLMIAEGATHRYVDSILAGMSPMRAFMMQAGDIGNILAMDNGGVAGGMAKVRALINPLTIGITALTAVVIAGAAAWYSYSAAQERMDRLAGGVGRLSGATGAQLEALAEQSAAASHITVGAARDIEAAYLETGKIGMQVLPGLTAVTANFAAGTGQDLEKAAANLADIFKDPAKGADELVSKYGIMDAATLQIIHDLDEQGRVTQAQETLLKSLSNAFDGAAEHGGYLATQLHHIESAASGVATSLGKAIDAAARASGQALADMDPKVFGWLGSNNASPAPLARPQIPADVLRLRALVPGANAIVDGITGDAQHGQLAAQLATINKLLADGGKAAGLSAQQLQSYRTAQDALTHAVSTYLPPAQKQAELDALDAKIAAERNPVRKAALASQRETVALSGQVITSALAQADAHNKGAVALANASRAGANHADQLAREAKAMEAQIAGAYALADAYGRSSAAALIEEATTKATSTAIKNRADIEAAASRQIQLAVAQRIADAAKAASAMDDQAAVQDRVNAAVTAGLIPASQASDAIRDQMEMLPLLEALQVAQQKGYADAIARATKAIEDQKAAQERARKAQIATQFNADMASSRDQLAMLQREYELIGATEAVRVHELAMTKALQEARARGYDLGHALEYAAAQAKIADATFRNAAEQRNYNDQLTWTADKWDLIARNVDQAAQGMANAFGHVGRAIGDMAATYADFRAAEAKALEEHERLSKAAVSEAEKDRENQRYSLETATQQIALYGDLAEAAKGFFGEHSKGAKVAADAEKAFRTVQLALSIKAMAQDAIETGTKIANSVARTATYAVEAVVSAIKSLPFPLNLVAGAATIAAIASLGVEIAGAFGGGGNNLPAANDGTGTVFGDSSAKSDSIKRSIEDLSDIDRVTMGYSAQMAASLKSIDSEIGGLTNLIVRVGGADGLNASAGVQTGYKPNAIGNIAGSTLGGAALGTGVAAGAISTFGTFTALGAAGGPIGLALGAVAGAVLAPLIKSLFGTKTSVIGSGIYGAPQTIEDILANGFDGSTYSDIQKKKKFFGITTGTSYSTQYGGLDSGIENQFALILKSFDDAIMATAGPLAQSTDAVEQRLNSFVVNIGKIDLQGLSGQQIQDKLEAVFGAAADNMAQAAVPGLEKFEKVGEGYFETLTRVASTVEAVTADFDTLGISSAKLGVDAKMTIAGLFDSVSSLNSATQAYFSAFYTDAEQTAIKTQQLSRVFTSLNLQMPDSIAGYRALVEAQDLTTDAGQKTYAELIQLAPAFVQIATAAQGATSAAAIVREHQDLEQKLLELQGDTNAIRAAELAKLDPSNRALQERIYALQDEQAATQAATAAAEQAAQAQQAITQEHAGLMDQLLQLQGNTAALRAEQLAKLDPSNRALQQQIFELQDAQTAQQAAAQAAEQQAQAAQQAADEAARAAQQLKDAWKSVADGILDEVNRIRGVTVTGPQSYGMLLDQFDRATALARSGDQEAAKALPDLSKALLDAAAKIATSQTDLARIQGSTAASLEDTYNLVNALTGNLPGSAALIANDNVPITSQSWWSGFAASQNVPASSATNDQAAQVERLTGEVEGMRSDLLAGLRTIAANTGKTAKILDNVTASTGGDAIATEAAA